jgi:hypothetical protein
MRSERSGHWSAAQESSSATRKRRKISYRTRFRVLERDCFACRYCGRRPPEVALEVDHVYPHAKGGDDDIENLATACEDCNVGKRDSVLDEWRCAAVLTSHAVALAYLTLERFGAEVPIQDFFSIIISQIVDDECLEEVSDILHNCESFSSAKDQIRAYLRFVELPK